MKKRPAILTDEHHLCGRREKLSEPAKVLLASIQDMRIDEFSDRELDDLERAAATVMSAVRQQLLDREGFVQKRWGRGSGRVPRPVGPLFDEAFYRLENAKEGEEVLVMELYRLDDEELEQLMRLSRAWDVRVEAMGSLHFPGRTVSVTLTRRERTRGRGRRRGR